MEEQGPASQQDKIDQILDLEKKNNKLLHDMHAQARMSFWSGVVLWIIILTVWALAYYYLYPYIVPYLNIIRALGANASSTPSQLALPSPAEVQAFLHLSSTTKP